jgi:hypothetical protein
MVEERGRSVLTAWLGFRLPAAIAAQIGSGGEALVIPEVGEDVDEVRIGEGISGA